MVATIRCLRSLFWVAAFVVLSGCDLYIPIFQEDPTTLSDDRSEEVQQIDERIRSDILSALVEREIGTLKNVTADVYEKRVLLVGTVTGAAVKETVGTVAASTDGVQAVINEIQVIPDSSPRDRAEDLSVENRLKANLRDSPELNSFNLRWHSVNGIVYMFGRVASQRERERALEVARSVAGVQDVVDHISVRVPERGQSWINNLL